MSKHLDNEVLREQRKSREEYLKLKKMQRGEMDAGPKPSEVAIVPKTPLEKLKNFWFHHSKVVLISLFFVICFVIFVVECANKPRYDIQVVYYTYTYALDENIEGMEEYFEKYAKDLNGDGEVHVNVINCSYEKKESFLNIKNANENRLQATIVAEANAPLFITDEDSYKHFTDVFEETFFAGDPVKLSNEFYKTSVLDDYYNLPENLTISLRKTSDTMIEKDKKAPTYFKESKRILEEITKTDE